MIINLFKYRNLALGCLFFLVTLYVSFELDYVSLAIVGGIAIITSLIFGCLYFARKSKMLLDLFARISCITVFVLLAIVISICTFQKDKKAYELCDGEVYEISGTVEDVLFNQEYFAGYSIKIDSVNGEKQEFNAMVTDDSASMKRNDIFKAKVVFSSIRSMPVGFDSASYYRDNGILIDGEIEEYLEISEGKPNFIDTLRGINSFLDGIIKKNLSDRAYPLVSALLLGNRDLLSRDTNRDFTRLGIVHILSLSGMHVSIIVTMLGFALSKTFLPSSAQFILISVIIFFFVGISGFSEPAIRAGLMQILFFSSYIFWSVPEKITTLFVTVTLICAFSPYLIFSIGLMLSFLAMVGCMLSAKLIYRTRVIYKLRSKLLRFCFLTLCTTMAVTFLCLPFTYLYFGSFSLASVLANIILVPIINIIIYLVPFILILLPIRFISNPLIYFCEIICDFVLDVCKYTSDFKNLLLPITSNLQLIASVLLCASVILIFILPRKKLKLSLSVMAVCIVIFIASNIMLFVNRNNNTYITAYSYNHNDAVCIEENNSLTVIDISNHSKSSVFSSDMSKYLGYGEISEYVILTYNNKSCAYFDKMTGDVVIRHIFLALPQTENEEKYFKECVEVLENKDIEYTVFSNELTLGSFNFDMNEEMYIERSTKRCIAFSLTKGNFKYSYFGASTFDLISMENTKRAYESDALVFGANGASFKKQFMYYMPNMEYCVFMGGSESFADGEFYEGIENKFVTDKPFKIRIKN
ncbi:MAG: ComEC/Rec2 family competence protein [Clostridia bacterium]|nr:ComEC/Rec2 family competence protein [Clostridia bacterium]